MLVVTLWPASDRPYVDGSQHELDLQPGVRLQRLRPARPAVPQPAADEVDRPRSWARPRPAGTACSAARSGATPAWLIPAALIALAGVPAREPATQTTCCAPAPRLWGMWLVVLLVVFSASSTINPTTRRRCRRRSRRCWGSALALAWEHRTSRRRRLAGRGRRRRHLRLRGVAAPRHGVGLVAGLPEAEIVLGLAALVLLARSALAGAGSAPRGRRGARRGRRGGGPRGGVGLGRRPTASDRSTPRSSSRAPGSSPARSAGVAEQTEPLLPPLEQAARRHQPDLMATQTSAVAAPFIYDSGKEVLPIGGYTGTIPEPSGAAAVDDPRGGLPPRHPVADGHRPPPRAGGPAMLPLKATAPASGQLRFAVYYCGRAPGL